jgi:addiction module RelE/StbE family toxin
LGCERMYAVEIEKRCLRELKELDKKFVKKAFEIIETVIAVNPYDGKKLKGKYSGLYSYRISDYRIIYEIVEKRVTIVVLRIAHRKSVYEGI